MKQPEHSSLAELEAYIRGRVLPEMNMAGRSFALEQTGLGNRNKIFFLNIDDAGAYILKGFTEKYRMKNSLKAHDFLARHTIPTPRVFFSDLTQNTFERFGCFFSCEERIAGKPLAELAHAPEAIPRIARFFAHMHAIRSFRWGKLNNRQLINFTGYTMRRIMERLAALKDSGSCPGDAGADEAWQWFEQRKKKLKAIKRFSLCHGDVNPANILFAADNSIVLIDNEAIKYLPFPIEYYRLQFSLCGDSAEARQLFEESYFSHARPGRRRELALCGDFFRAYVLLEFVWHYNKKLKQQPEGDAALQYYAEHKKKAAGALAAMIGSAGEKTCI
ncbi:MAG: aminoglycoside phosphotransferase family protein [Pseudomonadota bacterium]